MKTGEKVIIGVLVVALLWALGVFTPLGFAPPASVADVGTNPPSAGESTVANPVQVYVIVNCYEGIDADNAGLAGTASDQIIRIYSMSDVFIEQVTTSSGTITLSKMYWSGTQLKVQARAADVDSADPYVSKAVVRLIPHGENLETGATVSIDPIYVRDVTATAPTLKIWDVGGDAIMNQTAGFFLETTDNLVTIQISAIDSDTFYGPEDFTDLKTGRQYDGGVFLVWKGTVSQSFEGYKYSWSDPTYVYYVWEVSDYLVDDSTSSIDDIISLQLATTGSAALAADSTVVIDVYDIIWLEANLNSGDLINGGGVDTTAITTKIA